MRAAVLQFGFHTLGADLAITGAFATSHGSIRVSEKLGYLRNGVRRDRARNRSVDAHLFRLPREHWEASAREPAQIEGFDGCERFFGLAAGTWHTCRFPRTSFVVIVQSCNDDGRSKGGVLGTCLRQPGRVGAPLGGPAGGSIRGVRGRLSRRPGGRGARRRERAGGDVRGDQRSRAER